MACDGSPRSSSGSTETQKCLLNPCELRCGQLLADHLVGHNAIAEVSCSTRYGMMLALSRHSRGPLRVEFIHSKSG